MAPVIAAICVLDSSPAFAAELAGSSGRAFPPGQVFTFLFLMLGPFKIIGPFWQIAHEQDQAFVLKTAGLSIVFSSIALLLAAVLGEYILASYGIPVPVMALSGGLVLFLIALINILQQFGPPAIDAKKHDEPVSAIRLALQPLAFPTIVTPYGIATLVVFLAVSESLENRLMIGAFVLGIMVLNFLVMISSRCILPLLGIVLPILGAVLGVVQVALGLQIINNSLRAMGIL